MSMRDLEEGESLIPAIERDIPELSGWARGKFASAAHKLNILSNKSIDLAESEYKQCEICSKINLDDIAEYKLGEDRISRGPEHHKSFAELKECAISMGCHICKLLHFVKAESDRHSGKSQQAVKDGKLYLHRSSATLELTCYDGMMRVDHLMLRISTGKDCPADEPNENPGKGLPARLVEDDPVSTEAVSRAQSWVDYCRTNHSHCLSNEDVPLPTRVLDVQSATGKGDVSLLISNGQRAKFATLSHCWGTGSTANVGNNIRTCTSETYEELKSGFEMSRLPKTFQDAIIVTRKLGIRYLWIDSLCIMQDSRKDWSIESARMSEVYGNSFLTILASTAQNSDQGFLSLRDPNRYIMTKFAPLPNHPNHWTWLRWPLSEGKWDRSDRKITHRGWAFQEYSLPPRVLEYAPTEMEWHCNQVWFEEGSRRFESWVHDGYKELMWILSLPDITKPPGAQNDVIPTHSFFATPSGSEDLTIYKRWYELVEGYSGRELTFQTDKLPAIAGLAAKIQAISGDIYMAGLWKKDLGAGLCWQLRGFGDLTRPSKYIAPSWSWASLQGCTTHNIPEEHELHAELISFDIKTDELNPLGEVFSGLITISAPIRKLKIGQGTVWADSIELNYEVNLWTRKLNHYGKQEKYVHNHHYALSDQESVTDPRGTGMCIVCFDMGVPPDGAEEIILLKLTLEEFSAKPKGNDDKMVPYGIVLEKESEGGDVYKRIGVYSVADAEVGFYTPGCEHAGLTGWDKSVVTII